MIGKICVGLGFAACLAALQVAAAPAASAKELKVLSEKTITELRPMSNPSPTIPKEKVFYTSDFGPDLKPADKDGKGFITKLSSDGKVLEKRFLPPEGQTMNKPKGIWIKGKHLWVTEIDAVWEFDLKTK